MKILVVADEESLSLWDYYRPGKLADYVAGNIMLEYEDRQHILSTINPLKRLEEMCILLANEGNLLSIC